MEPHEGQTPVRPGPTAAIPGPASTGQRGGNEAVAEALRELDTVGQRPLSEHPDSFGRVHARLQQALSDIDDA